MDPRIRIRTKMSLIRKTALHKSPTDDERYDVGEHKGVHHFAAEGRRRGGFLFLTRQSSYVWARPAHRALAREPPVLNRWKTKKSKWAAFFDLWNRDTRSKTHITALAREPPVLNRERNKKIIKWAVLRIRIPESGIPGPKSYFLELSDIFLVKSTWILCQLAQIF